MFNIFNQEDKEKGSYWERNHQDNFGAIAVTIIIFNIAGYVIKIKDLSLTVALYVKAIKLKNSLQGGKLL